MSPIVRPVSIRLRAFFFFFFFFLLAVAGLEPESATATTYEPLAVTTSGAQVSAIAVGTDVSPDGRYVVFETSGDVTGPPLNAHRNVYLRDRTANTVELISGKGSPFVRGNWVSVNGSVSDDGRFVAFVSASSDLVANDTNGLEDVFVRDRQSGVTTRISVDASGNQAVGGNAWETRISGNGRWIAYSSAATNLVPGDTNGAVDVFVFDRQNGSVVRVNNNGAVAIAGGGHVDVSDDAEVIAFFASDAKVWTWKRSTGMTSVVDGAWNWDGGTVNGSGSRFASSRLTSSAEVYTKEIATSEHEPLVSVVGEQYRLASISGDGRFVSYFRQPQGSSLHYAMRYDRKLGSKRSLTDLPVAESWRMRLSGNGRLILVNSSQALSPSDTDGVMDPYLIDTTMDPDPVPLEQTFGGGPSDFLDSCHCLQGRTDRPINTATGAESLTANDVAIPGAGIRFEWRRSYTSLDTSVGPLGIGWTHPYRMSVSVTGNDAIVRGENGQQARYIKQPDGHFKRPAGIRATLVQDANGFTLTSRAHHVTTFDTNGRLLSMKLRGQGLTFAHNATTGNLETVTDAAGRVVTLTYTPTNTRLTRVTLPDGRYVGYTYDAANRLETVRDLRGGITTYAYDVGDRIASEKDPRQNFVFRNTYDPATGRVTSQLDPKGRQTTFAWDDVTQTATITDPLGGTRSDTYRGHVLVKSKDELGRETTFTYDDAMNRTSVTDPLGRTTTYEYDAAGNQTKMTQPAPFSGSETRVYDTDNNLTSVTDVRGKTTTMTYDALERISTVTNPDNKVTTYTYTAKSQVETITDVRGKVTTNAYDAAGNLTSVTSPLGKVTTMGYDGSGRMIWRTDPRGNAAGGNPLAFRTTMTYNDGDLPLTVATPLGHTTTFGYDAVGNRTTITDARNKVTTYGFDEMNRATTVTDPLNFVTATVFDDLGRVASVTDQTGGKTVYDYDAAGQLTDLTTARGNVAGANAATKEAYTTHYEYDLAGNQTKVTDPADKITLTEYDNLNRPTKVTDPLLHTNLATYDLAGNVLTRTDGVGGVTSFSYDNLGRLATVTSPRGNVAGATPSDYRTQFLYDEAGNRTEITAPKGGRTTWSYNDDGLMATQVDPRGYVTPNVPANYTTSYLYDDTGNLARITDPLGNQTNYTYDASNRRLTVKDARNNTTTYGYDEVDRLTSVRGPDAPACSGTPQCVAGKAATVYSYDDNGNLTLKRDAKNRTTSFEFDGAGRETKRTDPLAKFTTQAYDPEGNLTTVVTARGNASATPATGTITQTIDALGRVTNINYGDTTPDVTFSYDDAGRRTQMVDGRGTVNYTYDNADQVKTITRVSGDAWAYSYDMDGNISQRTYPDTTVVNATFDRDGNLASVAMSGQTTSFAYDQAGRLTTTTLPSGNGYVETRAYDRAGRTTQVKNAKGTAVLSQFTRTLDPVGNPTVVATLRGTTTTNQAYTYDTANRLTKWCDTTTTCTGATKWISYAYDAVGNRTQQVRTGVTSPGTTTYAYNNADQLTSETVGTAVTNSTYDADGNQLTRGANTFTYDLAGRMVSTKVGTATAINYTYDGEGHRFSRATGATVDTKYSWDTQWELPELALERTGANALSLRYLHGPTGVISWATSAPATWYLHRDQMGSITDITSSTGVAQSRLTYEPFGIATRTVIVASGPATPIQFTGEYFGPELALGNFRARVYDPATGRFMGTDPVTPPWSQQSVSRYAYVESRPTVLVDPSGLCSTYNKPDDPNVWRAYLDCMKGEAEDDAPISGLEASRARVGQAIDSAGRAIAGTARDVVNPKTYADIARACAEGFDDSGLSGCLDQTVVQPAVDTAQLAWDALCGDPDAAGEFIGALAAGGVFGRIGRGHDNGAAKGVTHAIPEDQLPHIFRDAPGHLPDTPANRKLLQGVADDPATTLGADKFGNTWSARTLDNGTQVWTQTRNGNIINGGLNQTPRPFNPQTGLSRQQPPRRR